MLSSTLPAALSLPTGCCNGPQDASGSARRSDRRRATGDKWSSCDCHLFYLLPCHVSATFILYVVALATTNSGKLFPDCNIVSLCYCVSKRAPAQLSRLDLAERPLAAVAKMGIVPPDWRANKSGQLCVRVCASSCVLCPCEQGENQPVC